MSNQEKLHKAICVLTWEIASSKSQEELIHDMCEHVRNAVVDGTFQLEQFGVKFDSVPLKKPLKIQLYKYDADLMLASINPEDKVRIITVSGIDYTIKTTSDRYALFKKSKCCVFCGIEGKYMILERLQQDKAPHLNLYAEEDGQLILMTKDHIVPRAKGGKNQLENYQVACSLCNQIKGSDDELSTECILTVRRLLKQKHMLTRKALCNRILEIKKKFKQADELKRQLACNGFSEVF